MSKASAVVVTYNRLSLLKECIDSLRGQTLKLDQIIVVNNGSTDGTDLWLADQADLLTISQNNSGGAGGFSRGIQEAYEQGFDWIWVMDDDCVAAQNCFEKMTSSLEKRPALCVAPTVINRDGQVDTRHRGHFDFSKMLEATHSPIEAINEDDIQIEFASFVGLMVSAEAIRKVGFPNRAFFIHNDDVEYCIRLNTLGKILLSTQAKIHHMENATSNDIPRKFLNHHRNRPPLNRLWIRYYGVRNIVWLKKKYLYHNSPIKSLTLMAFIAKSMYMHLKDIMLYDDYKIKRLNMYLNAYVDGWQGRFDNEKPKRLLS